MSFLVFISPALADTVLVTNSTVNSNNGLNAIQNLTLDQVMNYSSVKTFFSSLPTVMSSDSSRVLGSTPGGDGFYVNVSLSGTASFDNARGRVGILQDTLNMTDTSYGVRSCAIGAPETSCFLNFTARGNGTTWVLSQLNFSYGFVGVALDTSNRNISYIFPTMAGGKKPRSEDNSSASNQCMISVNTTTFSSGTWQNISRNVTDDYSTLCGFSGTANIVNVTFGMYVGTVAANAGSSQADFDSVFLFNQSGGVNYTASSNNGLGVMQNVVPSVAQNYSSMINFFSSSSAQMGTFIFNTVNGSTLDGDGVYSRVNISLSSASDNNRARVGVFQNVLNMTDTNGCQIGNTATSCMLNFTARGNGTSSTAAEINFSYGFVGVGLDTSNRNISYIFPTFAGGKKPRSEDNSSASNNCMIAVNTTTFSAGIWQNISRNVTDDYSTLCGFSGTANIVNVTFGVYHGTLAMTAIRTVQADFDSIYLFNQQSRVSNTVAEIVPIKWSSNGCTLGASHNCSYSGTVATNSFPAQFAETVKLNDTGVSQINSSDNLEYTQAGNTTDNPWVRTNFTLPIPRNSRQVFWLDVESEMGNVLGLGMKRLALWNYTGSAWVEVNRGNTAVADQNVTFNVTGRNITDFLGGSSGSNSTVQMLSYINLAGTETLTLDSVKLVMSYNATPDSFSSQVTDSISLVNSTDTTDILNKAIAQKFTVTNASKNAYLRDKAGTVPVSLVPNQNSISYLFNQVGTAVLSLIENFTQTVVASVSQTFSRLVDGILSLTGSVMSNQALNSLSSAVLSLTESVKNSLLFNQLNAVALSLTESVLNNQIFNLLNNILISLRDSLLNNYLFNQLSNSVLSLIESIQSGYLFNEVSSAILSLSNSMQNNYIFNQISSMSGALTESINKGFPRGAIESFSLVQVLSLQKSLSIFMDQLFSWLDVAEVYLQQIGHNPGASYGSSVPITGKSYHPSGFGVLLGNALNTMLDFGFFKAAVWEVLSGVTVVGYVTGWAVRRRQEMGRIEGGGEGGMEPSPETQPNYPVEVE